MRQQTLAGRRSMLGRMTLQLVNKNGPLSEQERTRLRSLRVEMDELEGDITLDHNRQYHRAFQGWLRSGLDGPHVTPEQKKLLLERRDMGTSGGGAYPGTPGGQFAPLEFYARVESALKDFGPMLAVSTIRDTATGSPYGHPEDNDTSISGEQVSENAQGSAQDISALSLRMLGSFKYSSKLVKVSNEMAQDTGFDLEAYLAERFAIRLGRVLNPKFTTGLGTTEPLGFVTQATVAGTAAGANSNDGTSPANTLGTDDFAALEAAVDPAYRRNGTWMMHSNTLAACRKVKNKQGSPVFPGLHAGGEDTIFNYPIAVNPSMDQLQANVSSPPITRTTLAFGDFSKYVIRRAPPILQRLTERFSEFGQTAFILWWRHDGALIDGGGGAVKVLQNVY